MVHQPLPNLYLIDLDQPRPGFHHFISSWVYKKGDAVVLVDPGPSSSVPVLFDALASIGVTRLDYVLITHIHIDHVGGLGLVLKRYPEARVLCHSQVVRHLVDPSKLWKGSLEVLGSLAELYGPIDPVPEANIAPEYLLTSGDLTIETIETPGHASHHVCFRLDDILFAGEVAGVIYPFEEGLYLRIASPSRFVYEHYRTSIQKAAAIDVSHLCFGHYGYLRREHARVFTAAQDQIDLWLDIVGRHLLNGNENLEEFVFDEILKQDPFMDLFKKLPVDVQERERQFAANSIRGMQGYLKERGQIFTLDN